MLNTLMMEFAQLKTYAQFILDKRLDEFVDLTIQRVKEVQLPLFRLFADFTPEQIFFFSKQSAELLLNSFLQGKAMEYTQQNIARWKNNELPNIPRQVIDARDLVFTPHTRKYAFIKLLKSYTADILTYEAIIEELEIFYTNYQEKALNVFMEIQHELLKNEKDFIETLLDNTSDGISAYDTDLRITVWNKALEQRTGVLKTQVLGRNLFEIFPAYRNSLEGEVTSKVLAGEPVNLLNMPLQGREGFYEAHLTPILNGQQKVIGGVTFSRDTTEQKKTEEQLKKNAALMSQAQSIANFGSWEWEVAANRITWSDELYRIFGYEPYSVGLSYKWILSHIHPEQFKEVCRRILDTAKEGGSFEITTDIVRQDKSVRTLHTKGLALFDEQGKLLKMYGASQDITDEKATKVLLQGVLNGSLAGLIYLKAIRDEQNRIADYAYEMVNEAAYRYLQRKEKFTNTTIIQEYPGIKTSPLLDVFNKVVQTGEPYYSELFYNLDNFKNWFKVYVVKLDDGLVLSFEDITFAKEAEAKLKKEKKFSDSLITNNINGIVSLDMQLHYTAWNPVMEKITGKKKEQVIGRHVLEVFPGAGTSEGVLAFNKALQGEKTDLLSRKYIYREGYFDSYIFPLFNEEGEITGVMSILHDVTERKQAEEKLLENQRFIQGIADATPNVLYVYDLIEKRNVYSNNVLLTLLGYTDWQIDNLDASTLEQLFHPQDLKKLSHITQQYYVLHDGSILDWEYRMLTADRQYKWFSAREVIYKRKDNGEPWQILGIAEDITEKKLALEKQRQIQAELAQKNKELADTLEELSQSREYLLQLNTQLEIKVEERTKKLLESEHQLRLITDALPILVSYIDAEQRFQFNNKAYEQWFGKPASEITGKYMWQMIAPDVYEQASPFIQQVLKGEKVVYDVSMFHGTEKFRHTTVTYIPRIEEGTVKGFYAIVIDITQRVIHEQALHAAFKEMEQKNTELSKMNELLDNFVYMAAHDLKSPVANLKLLAGMLVRTDNTVHPELFKAIIESVNRLDSTINGLVEVIEVQSVQDIPVKELDLTSQLTLIIKEYTEELQSSGGRIETDFSMVNKVHYVEAYLQSILRNLVSNAIKYHSNYRSLVLQISSRQEDGFVVLTFQDNGMGMNLNKYKQHLFKPFTRFTNKASGKGLGLHLIKTMVEKNGGKVLVESEPEKGTTFTLYLKEY